MSPNAGGVCQAIRNLSFFHSIIGASAEVACMDNESDDYKQKDDFIIHKLGNGRTSYQYQPLLLDWLKKNAFNYNIIFVHGLWQYHNLAAYQAIKYLKKKSKKVVEGRKN
jgi:hypothetical protein